MATDQTREAIWQELLDSARLVRYYDVNAGRKLRHSWRVKMSHSAEVTSL